MAAKLPAYSIVEEALGEASTLVSVSESHGLLCGLFAMGTKKKMDGEAWVKSVFADCEQAEKDASKLSGLKQLFDSTESMFVDPDFSFSLLLPEDDVPLSDRAKELGRWCYGFIAGLGLGGIKQVSISDENTREVLQHLQDISEIDYDNVDISEHDEAAYVEVVEYVRVAVMTIQMNLGDEKEGSNKSGTILH